MRQTRHMLEMVQVDSATHFNLISSTRPPHGVSSGGLSTNANRVMSACLDSCQWEAFLGSTAASASGALCGCGKQCVHALAHLPGVRQVSMASVSSGPWHMSILVMHHNGVAVVKRQHRLNQKVERCHSTSSVRMRSRCFMQRALQAASP